MLVTPHFSVEEFACHDGTPYPVNTSDDEDPQGRTWLVARLLPLCETLEEIRSEAGGFALHIDSGFRTLAYDDKIYQASAKNGSVAPASRSQHPKGRAADIRHPIMSPTALFSLILQAYQAGRLPKLGGIGVYPSFVHVDVRPRIGASETELGHLAVWGGQRPSNIA